MDLFAIFSLAAVNGCAGQGSARCKQYRNPKGRYCCHRRSAESLYRYLLVFPLRGFLPSLFHSRRRCISRAWSLSRCGCLFVDYPLKSVGGSFSFSPHSQVFQWFVSSECQPVLSAVCSASFGITVFAKAISFVPASSLKYLSQPSQYQYSMLPSVIMGCRIRFGFHKICVVGSVYFSVFLAAGVTDCLIGTGGCAAVVLAFIAAFRAYAVFPFVRFFCNYCCSQQSYALEWSVAVFVHMTSPEWLFGFKSPYVLPQSVQIAFSVQVAVPPL